jgi:alpha-D-xyloside xylohydrolase
MPRGGPVQVTDHGAPVLEAGKRSRSLYLPGGARWREGDTGEFHRGGVWIEVDAPLDRVPYFYRE